MRLIAAFSMSLIANSAIATTFDWPGAACSSTLQACVNAAAAGDEIEIVTLATVAEDLTINKSLRLYASGTAARFAAGRSISITAINNNDAITLENLWLFGPISGTVGSNNAAHTQSVSLNDLRIEAPAASGSSVSFARSSNAISNYTVTLSRSVIEATATNVAAVYLDSASASGTPTFNVLSNQITSVYDGISVALGSGRANILGNRVGRILPVAATAPAVYAISVEGRGAGGAAAGVQIARNVTFNFSSGVVANAISAPLDTRVINNTVAQSTLRAIDLRRSAVAGGSPPAHTGRVANNLVTRAQCGLGFNSSGTTVTANYNFFHATVENTCLGAVAGANDRSGTPQFVGGYDFRTRATSPNVDVGNNADQPAIPIIVAVPTPDFDSRNGRVNGTVDIGAYEFSIDASYEHATNANNTASNATRVAPSFGQFQTDVLQLGQFGRDLDTTPTVPVNLSAHLGLWFDVNNNQWTIFNQNNLSTLALQRRFFVLLSPDSNSNFVHVASAANSLFNVTTLDHPQLNNQPSALPIVTQRWDPEGDNDGTYNLSSIGVWYDTSESPPRWKVFNQAPVGGVAPALPLNAAFDVMIPNPLFANANHAFRTTPLGVPVTVLNIDHPLLNNTACAHPYVSAVYNPNNVYVPANLVLSYNPTPDGRGNWAIERGDGLQIPAGAAFHVYVDPQQSRRCRESLWLRDGFE